MTIANPDSLALRRAVSYGEAAPADFFPQKMGAGAALGEAARQQTVLIADSTFAVPTFPAFAPMPVWTEIQTSGFEWWSLFGFNLGAVNITHYQWSYATGPTGTGIVVTRPSQLFLNGPIPPGTGFYMDNDFGVFTIGEDFLDNRHALPFGSIRLGFAAAAPGSTIRVVSQGKRARN